MNMLADLITPEVVAAGMATGAVIDWIIGGALIASPKFRGWVWAHIKGLKWR